MDLKEIKGNRLYSDSSKVCKAVCELKPTSNAEKALIADIIKNGDEITLRNY